MTPREVNIESLQALLEIRIVSANLVDHLPVLVGPRSTTDSVLRIRAVRSNNDQLDSASVSATFSQQFEEVQNGFSDG